jgi:hypothetical protein
MKQFLSLMLAAVAGGAIALSGSGSGAQETDKADGAAADAIQGICVVGSADGIFVTLVNPRVRVLGDRQFLVGGQLGEDEAKMNFTKDRYNGAVMWIPLDSIAEIGQL